MIVESGGSAERFEIHGVAYREIRRFKIGETTDWVLCERIGVASVPFDAPDVILSSTIHPPFR
jgi:hypothetical protein